MIRYLKFFNGWPFGDHIKKSIFKVIIFFVFFLLLTFYYVGIRMKIFRNFFGKLFETRPKPQKLSPELISSKYNRLSDFLTGRNKLYFLPYSLSLFLSNVTPVVLLGIPVTVYLQGVQYFASLISFPIVCFIANKVFVPVFYNNQFKTASQYIGKRFNFTVKSVCLCLIIIANLLRVGIWLNTPNLILANFTTINEQTCLFLTILIVVIYTSLGGMDVMQKMERYQLSIVLFSLVSVVTKGIAEVGGIAKIIEENRVNKRLSFNFDLNPFTNRYSFWSILSSTTFQWCTVYSIQQTTLNRYLTSGTLDLAKKIIYTQIPLMMLFFFLICFIGLLMYTYYFKCDPLLTNRIDRTETLVGLFAYDMTYNRSGLLGLFIIALYSITLSSTSSSLNGLSTIIFQDIFKDVLKFSNFEIDSYLFIRISMCLFGIVIVVTMMSVKLFTQSFKLRTMLTNTLIGPVFAVFILGLHFRRINSDCALIALLTGLTFGLYVFSIHFHDSSKFASLGTTFDDCIDYFCYKRPDYCPKNSTISSDELTLPFYRYSFSFDYKLFKYMTYTYDGWIITIFTVLIGLLLSQFFDKPDINKKELEDYLATYMKRRPKTDVPTTSDAVEYVLEEGEEDPNARTNTNINNLNNNDLYKSAVDINYLKSTIDELIKRI